MANYKYQLGFSLTHPDTMYDVRMREQKARKILSVLDEYFVGKLGALSLLDIGCSTGITSNTLSKRFAKVIGIDIDAQAIRYAKEHCESGNLHFSIQDAMNLGLLDESLDVVICAHVYEHVPAASQLLSEIYRVLKPGGICYFAAENRLSLIEAHYKLPLLSIIPKPLANLCLRILKKGSFYYENHFTLDKLRTLVSRFEVIDYTLKVIDNPQGYYATEMLKPGSLKQKIATRILRRVYWLCPTYIWLLCKK